MTTETDLEKEIAEVAANALSNLSQRANVADVREPGGRGGTASLKQDRHPKIGEPRVGLTGDLTINDRLSTIRAELQKLSVDFHKEYMALFQLFNARCIAIEDEITALNAEFSTLTGAFGRGLGGIPQGKIG
jgi:hypothetical protein